MTTARSGLLFVVAAVAIFLSAATANGQNCKYNIYTQTGDVKNAGTDSRISLIVSSQGGQSFQVDNLRDWGQMGNDHDYWVRGQMDRFQGDAPCIGSPICKITVISDGSGHKPGWYCESILVSYADGSSAKTFNLNQWLEPGRWSTTLSNCPKT